MRVLMLLSNAFRPDARVYKEARTLLKAGFEVSIIAWDREQRYPEKEDIDRIKIIRTGPKAEGKKYFIMDVRKFWKNAEKIAENMGFDVIHAHDFDTLPAGAKIKKKSGAKLVFDTHEIYSDMIRIDVPSFVAKLVQRAEDHYLRDVDRVIVVNGYQKRFYMKRVGNRITVIMNAQDPVPVSEEEIRKIRTKLGIEGYLSLIYIGALEEKRFVKEFANFADTVEGVKIIIGGYGNCESYIEDVSKRKRNLLYLGYVPPDMAISYMMAADILVAMYKEVQLGRVVTKFFDGVSAGKPLIVADNGELTAELVKRYKMGVIVKYDINSFMEAVEKLKKNPEKIREMGDNAAKLRKIYSWKTMETRLIRTYRKLTSP